MTLSAMIQIRQVFELQPEETLSLEAVSRSLDVFTILQTTQAQTIIDQIDKG
jgi:hypothetical protein